MAKSHKRAALGITLVMLMPLLSGCWDRVETNDMAFVLTSSIDLEEDGKYRISYMFPLPGHMGGASGGGGGTSGSKSYYIDSEVGDTLRQATYRLQKRMARQISLSHRRTVIVGEELAKKGIHVLFDAVPRLPENRLTNFLIVTKGKGYELLNAEPKFERFPAEAIRELAKSAQAMPLTVKDVGLSLSFGSDPVVTYMEPKKSQKGKKPSEEIELVGYAQFRRDRMVGVYKDDAADGLMWMRNKLRNQLITLSTNSGKGVSILVMDGKTEIKPYLEGDQVSFRIDLIVVGKIREDLTDEDMNNPELIHKIEKQLGEKVKENVLKSIRQMQKEGTDSSQLGLLVWRKYPYEWRNRLESGWREQFKKASFQVDVYPSITETGLINQNVVKDEVKK